MFKIFQGGVARASNTEEHRVQQEGPEGGNERPASSRWKGVKVRFETGIRGPPCRRAEEALSARRLGNWAARCVFGLPCFASSSPRKQKASLTVAAMWLKETQRVKR